jgi:Arc/MetJ-type ribon-helix-helix transcriptional regulator
MRTEKISINLNMAELGQIDYLVDKGLYASRSDFIRLAIHKQTEQYQKEIEQFLEPPFLAGQEKVKNMGGVGIISLSKKDFEEIINLNHKIKIRVLGILMIDDSVTAAYIEKAVAGYKLYGKLFANQEVKEALEII